MRFLKSYFFAGAAGLLASTAVFAADLGTMKPAAIAPIMTQFNWTGFYVGALAGYGSGKFKRSRMIGGASNSYDANGVLAALHGGYNHQIGQFLIGAEVDFGYGNLRGSDKGFGGTLDATRLNYQGSVRARLGYAFDRVLIFATGGWAYGIGNHKSVDPGVDTDSFSTMQSGWAVGGGFEYALTNNFLLRAEYRYTGLGNFSRPAPTNFVFPYRVRTTEHTGRVGLSYKF